MQNLSQAKPSHVRLVWTVRAIDLDDRTPGKDLGSVESLIASVLAFAR